MKTNRNLKKGMMAIVMVMVLTIPNLNVYSAVGNYATSSVNLSANNEANLQAENLQEAAWLVAAAEAVALAYAAGYVLGTVAHHAYHLMDGHPKELAMATVDYDSQDFSKFDN